MNGRGDKGLVDFVHVHLEGRGPTSTYQGWAGWGLYEGPLVVQFSYLPRCMNISVGKVDKG